jgi:glucosamine-6-phosphate deaminase
MASAAQRVPVIVRSPAAAARPRPPRLPIDPDCATLTARMSAADRAPTFQLPDSPLGVRMVELPEQAARALVDELAQLLSERPDAVLAFPTGRTPLAFFEELARRAQAGAIDLSRASAVQLDEYCGLPPGHPASFRSWLETRLFSRVGFARQILFEAVLDPDRAGAQAARHQAAIAAAGGVDWLLLGIGRNGHIAFNEPGSPRDSRCRAVRLAQETRHANAADFPPGEAVPALAVSLGVADLLEARRLRVQAFGPGKAEVVRRALSGPIGPELPASFLRQHPDAVLWLDRAAAGELDLRLQARPA